MRKFYFFLVAALLMPIFASAQNNLALDIAQSGPYGCKLNMVEIPYQGLIEESIPATKTVCYSVGVWIKPNGLFATSGSQFTASGGGAMGMLFGFGTSEHTNFGQWQWGLGYDNNNNIEIKGDGGMGASSNGFQPNPQKAIAQLSKTDWSYVVFTIDNASTPKKAAVYVNGELKHEAEISNPGMYWASGDNRSAEYDGKWPTFQFFNYYSKGALDEVQFFNKALTAEEVEAAMTSAYTQGSLIGLYDFNETKNGRDGVYANNAPGGPDVDALYEQLGFQAYWGGSALVYRQPGQNKIQKATTTTGRTITYEDVNLELPTTEGGSITLTPVGGGDALTTGTHTATTMTRYTVGVNVEDGYALKGIYSEINGKKSALTEGGTFVLVAAAKVYGEFSNDFNAPKITVGEGAQATFSYKGNEVTDLTKFIDGETYTFTVTMTDDLKKLVEVKLNGEVMEAENGVYTFVSAADQTIEVVTTDKPTFVVTLVQPELGTLSMTVDGEPVASGTAVLENKTVVLAVEVEEGNIAGGFSVNGEVLDGNSFVVTEAAEVTVAIYPSVESCVPTSRRGATYTQTTGSGRGVETLVVRSGDKSITIQGAGTSGARNIYYDNTDKVLVVEAGATVTTQVTGSGQWMNTVIYGDFNFDGLDVGDQLFNNYNGACQNIPISTSFTVPAWAQEGRAYRVRYMIDWDCNDPCLFGQANNDNQEWISDFTILVTQPRIEATRNITISTNNDEFGTVAFLNPLTDAKSIDTDYAKVVAKATVTDEQAVFMNWTAGTQVVANTLEYTYTDAEDIALVANFGYPVAFSANEGGSLAVIYNGSAIASGDGVPAGQEISIEATPNAGMKLISLKVDGTAVTENPATVQVNAPMTIEAEFGEATYDLTINVTGNGTVSVANDMDDVELPAGDEYTNGDALTLNEELYAFFIANGDDVLQEAVITNGDQVFVYTEDVDGDCYYTAEAGHVIGYFMVLDSVNIEATFSDAAAIDGIAADDANAPVEFFNLQGIRVNGNNLTPGIYVRRQGSKTVKVYVTK